MIQLPMGPHARTTHKNVPETSMISAPDCFPNTVIFDLSIMLLLYNEHSDVCFIADLNVHGNLLDF